MAKQKNLKRIVTKRGDVRYYENGKRLKNKSGKRKWVVANPNVDKSTLNAGELRSLKALQKYNDGWKFNGVSVQSIYIDLLKKMGVSLSKAKNKDIATILDENGKPKYKNFIDVVEAIDEKAKSDEPFLRFCTEKGLPNYRGRDFDSFKDNTIRSIVDFIDLLNTPNLKSYKLVVIDTKGKKHEGKVSAILALRDFEIMVGEEVQNVASNSAFLKFCYDYSIDFKKREIIVDLKDRKKKKKLKKYIEESSSKDGDTLNVNDKYKNVTIEIMFS